MKKKIREPVIPPTCPYCGQVAVKRRIHYGDVWACLSCDARVGAKDDGSPLGKLADEETRALRKQVHASFDHIWSEGVREHGEARGRARSRAYAWLARQLDLAAEQCHVALFDAAACRRALFVLRDAWGYCSWADVVKGEEATDG